MVKGEGSGGNKGGAGGGVTEEDDDDEDDEDEDDAGGRSMYLMIFLGVAFLMGRVVTGGSLRFVAPVTVVVAATFFFSRGFFSIPLYIFFFSCLLDEWLPFLFYPTTFRTTTYGLTFVHGHQSINLTRDSRLAAISHTRDYQTAH